VAKVYMGIMPIQAVICRMGTPVGPNINKIIKHAELSHEVVVFERASF
jgi:hypothetical protein